jgi:hypothetical protein
MRGKIDEVCAPVGGVFINAILPRKCAFYQKKLSKTFWQVIAPSTSLIRTFAEAVFPATPSDH